MPSKKIHPGPLDRNPVALKKIQAHSRTPKPNKTVPTKLNIPVQKGLPGLQFFEWPPEAPQWLNWFSPKSAHVLKLTPTVVILGS